MQRQTQELREMQLSLMEHTEEEKTQTLVLLFHSVLWIFMKDLTKQIRKERKEHPWASYPTARRIALDHAKKKRWEHNE